MDVETLLSVKKLWQGTKLSFFYVSVICVWAMISALISTIRKGFEQ